MRRFGAVACVLLAVAADRASGQTTPAAEPPADRNAAREERRFEVASVKPGTSPADYARAVTSGRGGGPVPFPFIGVRFQPGGRMVANTNLQGLILQAYGIRSYQIEGGPTWLTTDYFDINAKAERETATESEMNEMLRSLLAERFGLRVHVESRQATVHTLTLARSDGKLGSDLKRTPAECMATLEERRKAGASAPPLQTPREPAARMEPVCGMTSERMTPRTATATFTMSGQPFSSLVARISREVSAPVADQTGLTGLFDVTLEFETSRRFPGAPPAGPDPNNTDPLPVPLPQALEQQLGLKLEKGIGPLPITIVDAAEHPSAN
jgi:uncharacterized protein (TIGR03435 family)